MLNAGNHLVCRFRGFSGSYLFRADDGKLTEDDYLLAESTLMNLLNKAGLFVPPVYKTDISMRNLPEDSDSPE